MALHRPHLDKEARSAEVSELITSVGLEDCAEQRAGNEIIRGLSSGNKVGGLHKLNSDVTHSMESAWFQPFAGM